MNDRQRETILEATNSLMVFLSSDDAFIRDIEAKSAFMIAMTFNMATKHRALGDFAECCAKFTQDQGDQESAENSSTH